MDPHLVTNADEPLQTEIAHVLLMDVVAYSDLKMRDQSSVYSQLKDVVRNTSEYRRNQGSDSVMICRSIGDGMAVVFFADIAAPIRCAIEITQNIRRQTRIQLRMGIHSGPVVREMDISQQPDVTGWGINIAERVMSGGDANHILLSRHMAEFLLGIGEWNDYISEIGEIEVKRGLRLHVYNFSGEEFGNPNPPKSRVSEDKTKPRVRSAGSSLSSDQSTTSINSEVFGNQRKPFANELPQTHLQNCGRCGMLLHRNSASCRYCGYKN